MGTMVYRCEAKGIQAYVLGGRKLRQMIGASALLEGLMRPEGQDSALELTLRDTCQDQWEIVSAAAAGATVAFESSDDLQAFVARWPRVVDQVAPGLTLVQGWLTHEAPSTQALLEADDPGLVPALGRQLAANRNRVPAPLPLGNPVLEREALGTEPAVGRQPAARTGNSPGSFMSRRTERMLGAVQRSGREHSPWIGKLLAVLGDRFEPDDFTDDLAKLAGGEERGYLAIVHADGNNVGARVRGLKTLGDFRRFSTALSEATRAAVRDAFDATCRHPEGRDSGRHYPIRPLVIGGDDLTVIVPAQRAIAFTQAFCTRFQAYTAELLGDPLTASAGVAFVRASHPVALGYRLAESLIKRAKHAGRQIDAERSPAMIAFHRVSTSLNPTDEALAGKDGADPGYATTGGPYLVGPARDGYWSISDLLGLKACFDETRLARGPLREMARAMLSSVQEAEERFERLRHVQRTVSERSWPAVKAALVGFGMDDQSPWAGPVKRAGAPEKDPPRRYTPWLDALSLRAMAVRSAEQPEVEDAADAAVRNKEAAR